MAAESTWEPLGLTDALYWSLLDDLEELAQKPEFQEEFQKWKEEQQ